MHFAIKQILKTNGSIPEKHLLAFPHPLGVPLLAFFKEADLVRTEREAWPYQASAWGLYHTSCRKVG
jgi:hypothetical protein